MEIQEAQRTGRLVIEAKRVHFCYGGRAIVRDFSTMIMRGDRVGLIGPNGSGKTTLLREAGATIEEVQRQLGHANPAQTQRCYVVRQGQMKARTGVWP